MRFLLQFLFWATVAFVACWWLKTPYEQWISETGARLAAPRGSRIEVLDMELFFPFDIGIYVALCLASTWATLGRRLALAALGVPVLVALELAALVVAFRVLMAAGGDPAAVRLVNGLFRVEGLVAAAIVWLIVLGHRHRAIAAYARNRRTVPAPPGRKRRRRGKGAAAVLVLATLFPAAGSVQAHGIDMSEMRLSVEGPRVTGEWELHLRDARRLLDLDPELAGEPGLAAVRERETDLRARIERRLSLTTGGADCPLIVSDAPASWIAESNHLVFRLAATCPAEPDSLRMASDLMDALAPAHRVYFSVADSRVTHVGVFREGQRSVALGIHRFNVIGTVREFVLEGFRHILSGVDHMVFLIALLLAAPVLRDGNVWRQRRGFRAVTIEITKVVTAFTLAHSLTLCLSFFGVIRLPAQWVEVTIAASVFAAAWNNIRPFLPGRAWAMALGFGLVHGMGFAGALGNLSLPRQARGLALGTFNVGVELGQLAIVAIALPVLYLASRHRQYPRLVMGVGSLVIAWLAVVWMLERGLGLSFFARS